MIQAIVAQQLPLQQPAPRRETSGVASVLCCMVRVVAAVASFFFALARSIFCCCCQRSLEDRTIQDISTRDKAAEALANNVFDAARLQGPTVHLSEAVKNQIIKIIAEIPLEERGAIMPLLKKTVLDGKTWLLDYLIKNVVAIHTPYKEEAIRCALLLITRDMSIEERRSIVEEIANLPHDERREAAELTLELIGHRIVPEFGIGDRITILKAVVDIPAAGRENVVHFTKQLITEEMHIHDIIQIMDNVARRPAHARAAYVAGQRAPAGGHAGFQDPPRRVNIENPVPAHFPDEIFANARRRAFAGLNNPIGGADVEDDDDDDVMVPALPRPRMQGGVDEAAVRAEHRALMQDGVNVHNADRDQLVKEAVEKLYAYQGTIPAEKIVAAADAFIDYLFTSTKNEGQKFLAIEALLKKDAGATFPPLIDGKVFEIRGLRLLGLELIGRLWIFTEDPKHVKDPVNAKEAMIGALAESYDNIGRVCNGGKTQRLVIKVLQGRFPGVNIDRVEIQLPLTTPVAMRLLLTPENQRIDDFNILMQKVEEFLKTTKVANKAGFLAEITAFAEQQGMENLPEKLTTAQAMELFKTPENQRIKDFNVLNKKAEEFLEGLRKNAKFADRAEFLAEITKFAELQKMDNRPKK